MLRLGSMLALFAVAVGSLLAESDRPLWHSDYDLARNEARERQVPLLLFFTGSDWCVWCQKLESGLFASGTFQQAAHERFVGVRLDFPRRVRRPLEERRQNRLLRHQWDVDAFPTVIWADPFDEAAILRHSYIRA